MSQKKTNSGRVAAEVGAGIAAAAAAAAAGYYFYGSKDAKKHRKIAAKWANDMKKEVVREAKMMKNIDAKSIARAIDSTARAYQGARSVDAAEVRRAAAELKANWKLIQREAGAEAKSVRSRAGKVAKRARGSAEKTISRVAKKARRAR